MIIRDIYFVRTNVWRLNRSFNNYLDATKYIKYINNKIKDIKLLVNGIHIQYKL